MISMIWSVGQLVKVNGKVGKIVEIERVDDGSGGYSERPVVQYVSGAKGRPAYPLMYDPGADLAAAECQLEYQKNVLAQAQKLLATAEKRLAKAQERQRVAQEFDLLRVMKRVEKKTACHSSK